MKPMRPVARLAARVTHVWKRAPQEWKSLAQRSPTAASRAASGAALWTPPHDIAHVIGHEQPTAGVNCHPDQPAPRLAVVGDEASEHVEGCHLCCHTLASTWADNEIDVARKARRPPDRRRNATGVSALDGFADLLDRFTHLALGRTGRFTHRTRSLVDLAFELRRSVQAGPTAARVW